METRELRYFLAVAEEQHVGRAAERLGIAQPPLSRAIAQLERRLGTGLFERTSRGMILTPAGSVLLDEGRAALRAVDAAERRVRRAAAASGRPIGIVLASKAGAGPDDLALLLDAYAAEPDAVPVEILLCGIGEQEHVLRDGRADVAVLHEPYDATDGLHTEALTVERQIVVLPAEHELATRSALQLADVAEIPGLPRPRWPGPDGTVAGGPGPVVRDHAQLHQLIALGRASWLAPESSSAHLPDGLAAVPVLDAPMVTTVIAWPPQSRSAAVAHLVRVATRQAQARRDTPASPAVADAGGG
jgi:DNA-binding transcriptional LysR family regulator